KLRAVEAQANQDLPFEQVVEIVNPQRSVSHTPLFQVMFGWQNNEAVEFELPELRLEPVGAPYEVSKFDLSLDLGEDGNRIAGGLTYAKSLFERSAIERYCGYFRNALRAMASDDEQAIDRIELLSPSERYQALVEWNETDEEYPSDRLINELFEAQALRRPD